MATPPGRKPGKIDFFRQDLFKGVTRALPCTVGTRIARYFIFIFSYASAFLARIIRKGMRGCKAVSGTRTTR